jgi:hypothetical protein
VRAGGSFEPPLDTMCLEPNAVLAGMADPNTFTGASSLKVCLRGCGLGLKDCDQYVKLAVACQKSFIGDRVKYGKASCSDALSGSGEHDCKLGVADERAAELSNLGIAGDSSHAGCAIWHDQCVTACNMAMF